jgi:NAD(P)-dependent dehydrogenase (short-subunit alcohol dehydrogenase family)
MSGRVEGKVAFITGAGRGQGRSHAIRLAEEGADIIAVDVLQDYPTVRYAMSSRAELGETVRAVEALGRRIVAAKADVRDAATLSEALDAGVAELGRLDIVCANAGIYTVQPWDQGHPAGVAGHHRHEPDRGLEHHGRGGPSPHGRRWRVDHRHQLHRRPQGHALSRPLRCG